MGDRQLILRAFSFIWDNFKFDTSGLHVHTEKCVCVCVCVCVYLTVAYPAPLVSGQFADSKEENHTGEHAASENHHLFTHTHKRHKGSEMKSLVK